MKSTSDRSITVLGHIVLAAVSIACIVPFLLLIMTSITDNTALIQYGYRLFPQKFSMDAYHYLFAQADTLGRAYGITVFITAVGTSIGLVITSMLAYALAQRGLPGGKVLSFLVVFTMLFNGGLVPTYLWYVDYLHIKNTLWALIIPSLLTNGFIIMIATNYFKVNVPEETLEAARIDGAGEYRIFFNIVVPFSRPILAAIGLMQGIQYWNDWRNGLYYITNNKLFSIQNILNRMIQDIQFLSTTDVGGNSAEYMASIPTASVRMAIAVVVALPILVIYPFFQKHFAKGLTIGAVKG